MPLFERTGRNTTLTRFGEEFLECAQRSLGALDVGIDSLQRSAKGEGIVRLGFLRTLGVEYIPKLTADFLAADPDCGIQFSFHSGLSGGLIDGLLQRKFDLVFCSEPDPSLGLAAVPVMSQELVMIVPKNHPLADRKSVDLADTLEYPAVFFAEGSGLRKVIDRMYEQVGGVPCSYIETEEDEVIAGIRRCCRAVHGHAPEAGRVAAEYILPAIQTGFLHGAGRFSIPSARRSEIPQLCAWTGMEQIKSRAVIATAHIF